jgi:hypothetical protein
LGIFTLYFILNLSTLIDIHLDYEEAKLARKSATKTSQNNDN